MSDKPNFIESFCNQFQEWSYGNDIYGRLSAHVLLGQVLKDIKIWFGPFYIDPRVSFFYVAPSGTGKSTPWDFVKKTAKNGGIAVNELDEASDAALIGTVEQEVIIDPETGTRVTQYNTVVGQLATTELLYYDEGQMLLNRTQHAQNTLLWFQKALNPIGSGQNICSKKLAHGDPIEIAPICSLIVVSYPVTDILEDVLATGFFQRIIFYPKDVSEETRKNNEFTRADKIGRRTFETADTTNLGEELNKIRAKYKDYVVTVDDKIKPNIKVKIDSFYKLLENSHEVVKNIMLTFIPRYDNFMYVVALHHMCARYGDSIEAQDINYSYNLVFNLFKNMMIWVEEVIPKYELTTRDKAYHISAMKYYMNLPTDEKRGKDTEGFVYKVAFMTMLSREWRMSPATVSKLIEKLKLYGKLTEKETGEGKIKKIRFEVS